MGMFDRLYDTGGAEWQTKAYACELLMYVAGDEMPPTEGDLSGDYQVEVLGGPERDSFIDAFATVRGGALVAVGVDRDPSLPRVGYGGHLVEDADTGGAK